MSLVACYECAKEVSTDAPACPHCGAPVKAPQGPSKVGAQSELKNPQLWLIVLTVAFVVIWTQMPDRPPTPSPEPLKATVRDVGGYFAIQNNDPFPWEKCEIQINSDYKVLGVSLAAGEIARIAARDFVTSDGARFNPVTTKAQEMWITCNDGARQTLVGRK